MIVYTLNYIRIAILVIFSNIKFQWLHKKIYDGLYKKHESRLNNPAINQLKRKHIRNNTLTNQKKSTHATYSSKLLSSVQHDMKIYLDYYKKLNRSFRGLMFNVLFENFCTLLIQFYDESILNHTIVVVIKALSFMITLYLLHSTIMYYTLIKNLL